MKNDTLVLLAAGGTLAYLAWPKTVAAAAPAQLAQPSGSSLAQMIAQALKSAGIGGSSPSGGGSSGGGSGGGVPSGGSAGGSYSGGSSGGGSPSRSPAGPTGAQYGPIDTTIPYQPVVTTSGTYVQTPDGGYVTVDQYGNYVDDAGNILDPSTLSDSGVYANMPADYGLIDADVVGYDYVGMDTTDTTDTTDYSGGSDGTDWYVDDYTYDT